MPNNIATGMAALFTSRKATVVDMNGKVLWEGLYGENASFTVDGPTRIKIKLGGFANDTEGIVNPRCKYRLVQDLGVHMYATFRLTEVDVIG